MIGIVGYYHALESGQSEGSTEDYPIDPVQTESDDFGDEVPDDPMSIPFTQISPAPLAVRFPATSNHGDQVVQQPQEPQAQCSGCPRPVPGRLQQRSVSWGKSAVPGLHSCKF